MLQYLFHIEHDGHSRVHSDGLMLPDKEAASKEAAVCADLIRGMVSEAAGQSDWRLDALTRPENC